MNKMLIMLKRTGCLLFVLATGSLVGLNAQSWYSTAEQRIDTLRKGDFTLLITDEIGNPVTDSVYVHLKKHEFPWGNTVAPLTSSSLSKWNQAALLKYYNYGVVERFKWPYIEPAEGNLNYAEVDSVYAWAGRVGWDIRAHTLLWGGSQNWQMPGWTLTMEGAELYNACETHIRREVGRYKDIIPEYDVYNEPMHETWLATTAGDSIKWNSFKWAHETDTNARLFVNDYNIIVWGPTQPYVDTIQSWINRGAPVTGIGCQGHMEGTLNWSDIKTRLDMAGTLGLPIKVTEFDMKIDEQHISEQSMASAYGMMMRTCFSHPSIEGFVWWGYIDPTYRNGSGIFSEDKRPKIAADTVYHLIHEKWSTRFNALPEADGSLSFHGFYGDYDIGIKDGDEYRVVHASCRKINNGTEIAVSLSDAIPEQPILLSASHNADGSIVYLYFDKEMEDPSASPASFVIFAPITINSASLNASDHRIIELNLASTIGYGNYYCVVYTPGTLASTNGGILPVTGPETIVNKIPGIVAARTTIEGDAVELSLSSPMNDPAGSLADFEIKVNSEVVDVTGIDFLSGYDSVFTVTLSAPVNSSDDVIKISYTRGTLTNSEGYLLDNFSSKAVDNMLPSALEIKTGNYFSVYPNPFTDMLVLECRNNVISDNISLLDIAGRTVKNIRPGNQSVILINTSDMEKGIYTLRIVKDGELIAVRKVCKE